MSIKLLTRHYLEFLRLKGGRTAKARLSLHLSNCHIVGNHIILEVYFDHWPCTSQDILPIINILYNYIHVTFFLEM